MRLLNKILEFFSLLTISMPYISVVILLQHYEKNVTWFIHKKVKKQLKRSHYTIIIPSNQGDARCNGIHETVKNYYPITVVLIFFVFGRHYLFILHAINSKLLFFFPQLLL